MQILLATGNKKKRAEFERLFAPLGIELMPAGPLPDTIEDQPTFAGNAAKKPAKPRAPTTRGPSPTTRASKSRT